MSDANVVARLIDEAGTRMIYLEYIKKSGEKSSGVFHPKVSKHLRGGEDSTKHIPYYRNLFNQSKGRYAKINLMNVTKARINGKTYNFQ